MLFKVWPCILFFLHFLNLYQQLSMKTVFFLLFMCLSNNLEQRREKSNITNKSALIWILDRNSNWASEKPICLQHWPPLLLRKVHIESSLLLFPKLQVRGDAEERALIWKEVPNQHRSVAWTTVLNDTPFIAPLCLLVLPIHWIFQASYWLLKEGWF